MPGKTPHKPRRSPIRGFYRIPGYRAYYINRKGDVYSTATDTIMSPHLSLGNQILRLVVQEKTGKRRSSITVARLMALAFRGKPPTETAIAGFKDGDKSNTTAANVIWLEKRVGQLSKDRIFMKDLHARKCEVMIFDRWSDVSEYISSSTAGAYLAWKNGRLFKERYAFHTKPRSVAHK